MRPPRGRHLNGSKNRAQTFLTPIGHISDSGITGGAQPHAWASPFLCEAFWKCTTSRARDNGKVSTRAPDGQEDVK